MASVSTDKNGTRRIQFVNKAGKRKAIHLGKVSIKTAEDISRRVELLNSAAIHGEPLSNPMAEWLADLDGKLRKKLAKVGLVVQRDSAILGPFINAYIAGRTDAKPATLVNLGHTERCLVAYFGADRAMGTITERDAKQWERWLQTAKARENRAADGEPEDGLAINTVRKRVSNAKQFFADAVAGELIRKNPFAKLSGSVGGNEKRAYFVTREEAEKVLEKCPDAQWKLLFALSRYGGLRCPSEHLGLTWGDIDLPGGRMIVHSPKTEHHPGGATREVPIFPELRPYLEDAYDLLPEGVEGTQHVITRYREANANLRTQLNRIIRKAGLTPWPKLFHNLRATRETELAKEFPIHVVCKWIGNSAKVAAAHYLQVTDSDFEKAAHKTAQAVAVSTGSDRVEELATIEKPGKNRSIPMVNACLVGVTGFEPVTSSV